ncbi:MAG TPA: nuclear transport factor 2 family protein [Burkholderiaceae bacterium]|nr:nuclear transport factor 2 family protein [Burkholderiaceae bacterium]
MIDTVGEWDRIVRERDGTTLAGLLAEDVVFHSPVVHTPQRGRPIVMKILAAAVEVLGNPTFRYVREFRGTDEVVLEFDVTIDGIEVNGVDMIRWDASGRIVDFKVLLRPLQAINLIHRRMAERLQPPR